MYSEIQTSSLDYSLLMRMYNCRVYNFMLQKDLWQNISSRILSLSYSLFRTLPNDIQLCTKNESLPRGVSFKDSQTTAGSDDWNNSKLAVCLYPRVRALSEMWLHSRTLILYWWAKWKQSSYLRNWGGRDSLFLSAQGHRHSPHLSLIPHNDPSWTPAFFLNRLLASLLHCFLYHPVHLDP